MVLINIDTLTESELRYIAKQENIENWDTLTREDLIEVILDFYGEDELVASPIGGSDTHKYLKGLTNINSDFLQLPGVDPLPKLYNETSIHLIFRDCNWAYAFWSISASKTKELEESGASLKLRLIGGKNSYEINITYEDNNWNIELPWPEEEYVLKLISCTDGQEETIATTPAQSTGKIHFLSHSEELEDSATYNLLVKPMISREGQLVSNSQVSDILSKIEEA